MHIQLLKKKSVIDTHIYTYIKRASKGGQYSLYYPYILFSCPRLYFTSLVLRTFKTLLFLHTHIYNTYILTHIHTYIYTQVFVCMFIYYLYIICVLTCLDLCPHSNVISNCNLQF